MVTITHVNYSYNPLSGKRADVNIYFNGVDLGSMDMLEQLGQALIDLAKSNPTLYPQSSTGESSAVEIKG